MITAVKQINFCSKKFYIKNRNRTKNFPMLASSVLLKQLKASIINLISKEIIITAIIINHLITL